MKKLENRLTNMWLLNSRAYVHGQWVTASSGAAFDVRNPSDGQVIASVPDMSALDARAAIEAATAAQPAWAAHTGKERAAILHRWFELMVENVDDLAAILTAEMGKPLREARNEVLYGASYIEWFAEEAKRTYGEVIPGHQRDKRIVVIRQPVGTVAAITPWNFPNAMICRKAAPALAAGCSIVCRPAAETPLSALAIAAIADQAGIPAGLFNVVTSRKGPLIGAEFTANPQVAKLTFTGSTEVGRLLMTQSAAQVQKTSMELGGNAPFIVFADADLEAAVEGAMISKFRNNGQTCVCANRIYVQEPIYDAFATAFAERVARLRVGDGFDAETDAGPLISEAALQKVEEHLNDALAKGARILTGGRRHALGGTYYEPTVMCDVPSSALVANEETFGPFAPLFRFSDEADVIRQANDTIFGLASYFYARDLNRVWRVAEALKYGIVGINTGAISTEVAPFGGVKQSGTGREGSRHGIDDYMELKYMCFGLT